MEASPSPSIYHSTATTPSIATSNTTEEFTLSSILQQFDLDKYIAIGTLVIKCESWKDAQSYDSTSWSELDAVATSDLDASNSLGVLLLPLVSTGWLRLFLRTNVDQTTSAIRIYLLSEDVSRATVDRSSSKLRRQLKKLLSRLQTEDDGRFGERLDPRPRAANGGDRSLWYIFNTVPSPAPDVDRPIASHDSESMQDLLYGPLDGIKTQLYPFQARTAAAMVERETAPESYLDPRFEERTDQDGRRYYFSPKDAVFLREPQQYETTRGGILAESMGYGKTLICLAVIVATKHHMPRFPVEYPPIMPKREHTASLLSMTAANIARHALPWRRSKVPPHLVELLQSYVPAYNIPPDPIRFNRNPSKLPIRHLTLSHCTLLVVPDHLFDQWISQIHSHVEPGVLSVLYIGERTQKLPCASELVTYDTILFTKSRFELEILDGQDVQGRSLGQGPQTSCQCPYIGASRLRDCTCLTPEEIYKSPLKEVHWLRIVVDEGHGFASPTSAAVRVANQLQAERRWVVSGTPAKGLVGVEIDDHYHENLDFSDHATASERWKAVREARKGFLSTPDETHGAQALGLLASRFLKVQPFTGALKGDNAANWNDYIYRGTGKDARLSGYSSCLSRTLERLIIKTRPEDVEKDLQLPPLNHRVVRLEPSFYDKMTTNMFVQVMRGNAITSERADRDYLFHKDNEKPRHELIRNLRQANFFWTGFSPDDVASSLDVCSTYLDKAEAKCTAEDRKALLESMDTIKRLPGISTWEAMGFSHELGIYVDPWPEDYLDIWALNHKDQPAPIGLESLYQAQIHVNSAESAHEDPLERFNAIGIDMKRRFKDRKAETEHKRDPKDAKTSQSAGKILNSGVPSSILTSNGDGGARRSILSNRSPNKAGKKSPNLLKRKAMDEFEEVTSPSKRPKFNLTPGHVAVASPEFEDAESNTSTSASLSAARKCVGFTTDELPSQSPTKPRKSAGSASDLPMRITTESLGHSSNSHATPQSSSSKSQPQKPSILKPSIATSSSTGPSTDSGTQKNLTQLHSSTLLGTTSAKASYLIDAFTRYTPHEKVLVFFDCITTARYIQSLLDLLHIGSRHFAYRMPTRTRAKNKTDFQENPLVRVLLIDVKLGGEGLDLNAASVVLIVNPICQPALEAQVIKRAHRIGQTRRVLVETLILKGTVEEELFEMSMKMTRKELGEGMARNERIRDVLLNAKIIPVGEREHEPLRAMARLAVPQKIFGRENWKAFNEIDDDDDGGDDTESKGGRKRASVRKGRRKKGIVVK
ncbi:hypothetical protein EJ05DRAFT_287252 [Pseudovirgaria hyperparasitica]|uniref:Helicase C-terminal domain-containing protein n=1 Tax=Pseudovirgaria hyperparasitica TaxID=470096 RepID=A0A6A6WEC4_9PEZI|nr:uncharacterized protein EJ05DRAFT_287252 [Pseudovirgaria hyperparasitica]KAF2760509.1 hypothetical protein EJ05DRAFT_287252 [Pseudovirgaria hyperparasitica]